jgi:hypothetical protein
MCVQLHFNKNYVGGVLSGDGSVIVEIQYLYKDDCVPRSRFIVIRKSYHPHLYAYSMHSRYPWSLPHNMKKNTQDYYDPYLIHELL